jgi:hypothetical protein
MRGFFVLVIIIDHLQRWPGGFDWITGQGRLWASAAEGFILISGIMIGLIRGRNNINIPFKTVTKKIWWRAFTLYIWAVITALATLAIATLWKGNFMPYPPGLDSYETSVGLGKIWQTVSLQGTFGWSVFLVLYAVFLAIAPAAVWLLRKGWWKLIILVSLLVWIFGFGKNQMLYSWQILFFGGTVIGFYFYDIQEKWQNLKFHEQLSGVVLATTAITIIASVLTVFGWSIVKSSWTPISYEDFLQFRTIIDPYFLRNELPPLRLLISLLWFSSLYIVFNTYQQKITQYAGWLLLRFGQNSLFVYILQGFIVVLFSIVVPQSTNILVNAIVIVLAIMLIWWLTSLKFLHKIIPR